MYFQNIGKVFISYFERYGGVLLGVYLISIVAYGYMVTTVVFTNHTLPNVWEFSYPSFKTLFEGRWLADVIIYLGGGSGVQLMQAVVAIAIVTLNGFIFFILLGLGGRLNAFLAILFISLYPAFFDYYSFTIDHITFALGDTFALVGVLALDKIRHRLTALLASIILFTLSIASYQPKISLVAVLLIIWCLLRLSNGRFASQGTALDRFGLIAVMNLFLTAAVILFFSTLLYFLTLKLTTVSLISGPRGNINNVGAMLSEVVRAYPETYHNFTSRVSYLPVAISYLPLLVIVAGFLCYLWKLRRNIGVVVAATILFLLFPIALQLTYVINSQAWSSAGRIMSSHAYFFGFFIFQLMRNESLRIAGLSLTGLLVYFFFIVVTQGANHAAMKHIYDVEKINRIAYRIEQTIPDLYQKTQSIVVFGGILSTGLDRLQRLTSDPYRAHTTTETFAPYRQVDILNFFFGHDVLRHPTKQEITIAVASASGRRPWPAPESVYSEGNVIVVILEQPGNGVATTWSRD